MSFQADDYLKAGIVASANAPNPVDRAKDPFAGLPAQVIAVDIPLGTITGAAPGTARIERDVVPGISALSRGQKSLTVAARAWRPAPAAAGARRYVEFQIVRSDSFKRTGLYDGQQFGALLLRCTLYPDGRIVVRRGALRG